MFRADKRKIILEFFFFFYFPENYKITVGGLVNQLIKKNLALPGKWSLIMVAAVLSIS